MHFRLATVWTAIYTLSLVSPSAVAFSFTNGDPTQCDNLNISWTGGTAPFQLLLAPIFGTQRVITIPASAFSNGRGTYATPLPFPKGQQFLISMSDAAGFGTGGTSDLLHTGASLGGSCNVTDPGTDFTFELNTALQQCRPYTFSGFTGAVQPVTITGLIPLGQSIVLHPPTGPTIFDWVANVARGTSMVFMMSDSRGRVGGSSDIELVGSSDDSTCLSNLSPSSTASPSPTSNPSPSSSPSASAPTLSPTTGPTGSKTSIVAIAATVIGALIFLAATVTLGLFFIRKRKNAWSGSRKSRRQSHRSHSEVNLTYDTDQPALEANPFSTQSSHRSDYTSTYTLAQNLPPGHEPNPFILPPPQPYDDTHSRSTTELLTSYGHQSTASSSSNDPSVILPTETAPAPPRKNGLRGLSYTPSRFILHTDVEDEISPNEDGVIELPPQYSERRAPLPGLSSPPGVNNNSTPPLSSDFTPSHLPELRSPGAYPP